MVRREMQLFQSEGADSSPNEAKSGLRARAGLTISFDPEDSRILHQIRPRLHSRPPFRPRLLGNPKNYKLQQTLCGGAPWR